MDIPNQEKQYEDSFSAFKLPEFRKHGREPLFGHGNTSE